jgi:hypothetical protein
VCSSAVLGDLCRPLGRAATDGSWREKVGVEGRFRLDSRSYVRDSGEENCCDLRIVGESRF